VLVYFDIIIYRNEKFISHLQIKFLKQILEKNFKKHISSKIDFNSVVKLYRKAFKSKLQSFKQITMKNCPECGSKKLENRPEALICKSCGAILKENFYSGGKIV